MIAIEITQEIKDKNAKYNLRFVKGNDVGVKVKTTLPNKFHVTEPCSGGYKTRTDLHTNDGFKEIVIPSFDAVTQKLGTDLIDSDGKLTFTYEVIDLTAQEVIDLADQVNEQNSENSLNINVQNGRDLTTKSFRRMYRRHKDSDVSPNNQLLKQDVKDYMNWNKDSYLYLSQGNYYGALDIVNQIIIDKATELTNSRPLEKMFVWLQEQIQDYINNEYDL